MDVAERVADRRLAVRVAEPQLQDQRLLAVAQRGREVAFMA
jgi:hypothetical protein